MQENETPIPSGAQTPAQAETAPDKKGKKNKKEKPKRTVGQEILSWVLTFAAALAIAFVVRTFICEPVRVDGASMNNTLADGEIMFVGKTGYGSRWLNFFWQTPEQQEAAPKFAYFGNPPRFDVVICRYPNRGGVNFVKRVVGLPGDRVSLTDGRLNVNGEAYEEPYIDDSYRSGSLNTLEEVLVPAKGDVVTLSADGFTVGGEAYPYGYASLRVAGEGGAFTLRRVYRSQSPILWVTAGSQRYLYDGRWYRALGEAELAQAEAEGAEVYSMSYEYPNENPEWVLLQPCDSPMAAGDYTVQEDYYFLMGDHRNNSNDSRSVGAVERTYIIGAVRQVIWPLGQWRSIVNGLNAGNPRP